MLAHSDIAPSRKRDPGEKFPWRILHGSGIGIWVPPAPIEPGPIYVLGDRNPAIEELQGLLAKFGYAVPVSGNLDGATRDAIAAFQRHFRQARADGVFDASTLATLRAALAARDRVRATEAAIERVPIAPMAAAD